MKGWQVVKPTEIEEITRSENLESVSYAKVKITKALLTDAEALVFSGEEKQLPVIPGRSAVGIIVESAGNVFGIEKGARVYINPVTNCGECYNCRNSQKTACTDLRTAGENTDGYFRDFAVLPCSDLYALPESVSDESALFLEHIALAITITDKLNISKGEHIAVIGGGVLGNLLSQLIIYYRGVPILIDRSDEKLTAAQKSGIYYTVKHETQPQVVKAVAELTGGRMTEKSVYITDSCANTKIPFVLTSFGGSIAFAGFDANNVRADIAPIMKKKLHITGITDGFGQTEAAINILVNKALDFSALNFGAAAYKDVPSLLSKRLEKLKNGEREPEVILNMM